MQRTLARHMKTLAAALLALALVACGFQLRGNYQMPEALQRVALEPAQPHGDLLRHLRRYLESADVALTGDGTRLNIGAVRNRRRVISVDGQGRPREYELTSEVTISVAETKSGFSMPETTLQVQRDYFYDPEGVLSAGDQERQLREDMEQDLALRIMYRLQGSGKKPRRTAS